MPKRPNRSQSPGFVLGRAAFDRISAVEGLRRDADSEAMFADFDRRGLGAEERRQAIRARHGARAAGPAGCRTDEALAALLALNRERAGGAGA